jgi:hypothetical protein
MPALHQPAALHCSSVPGGHVAAFAASAAAAADDDDSAYLPQQRMEP